MHFFIEPDKLTVQADADKYGPEEAVVAPATIPNPTGVYNVTTRFQLATEAKAFACQDSMMIVQQSLVDPTLVNIILKPLSGESLKIQIDIKYYVYRGILKSSLIDSNNNITPTAVTNNDLINRIWNTPPSDTTCLTLGYNSTSLDGSIDIESVFDNSRTDIKPILVKEGEWFGTFATCDKIGFEVLLNTNRFTVDLNYVRSEKHQVLTTGLTLFAEKAKREEILYFIDPAAFFGMHHNTGINYYDASSTNKKAKTVSTPQTSPKYIFSKLLNKFATKHRLYFDLRSEKGYSYNFYGNYFESATNHNIKIGYGNIAPVGQQYGTHLWPIIYFDNVQTINNSINKIRFQLRINDNIKPILYIQDNLYKLTRTNSKFTRIDELIGTSTEWCNEISYAYPNTGSGVIRNNIPTYIKAYYFKEEHNAQSPWKNKHYYDSAFCSIDIPNLGICGVNEGTVIGEDEIYIREKLDITNGIGNFGFCAETGAYWDSSRILFYSKMSYLNDSCKSGKSFIATYEEKMEFNCQSYIDKLKPSLDIICREYSPVIGPSSIKVPGINSYKDANGLLQEKQSLILLGVSINELSAIKNTNSGTYNGTVVTFSAGHQRYLFIEQVASTSTYQNPEVCTDNNGDLIKLFVYKIKLQGFNLGGNRIELTPQYNAQDIFVYSRDNQFFSSNSFSLNIPISTITSRNRLEFHIFSDGAIRINDNIDLSILYDPLNLREIHYFYYNINNQHGKNYYLYVGNSATDTELCHFTFNLINRLKKGVKYTGTYPPPPANWTSYTLIGYTNSNVDANFSFKNDNGDIITAGGTSGTSTSTRRLYIRDSNQMTFIVFIDESQLVRFSFEETIRKYASLEVTAAFLGAYKQITNNIISRGFGMENGDSFPSYNHVNGLAIDTAYFYTFNDDIAFIEALHKFGFNSMTVGHTSYLKSLDIYTYSNVDNKGPYYIHDSHLHTQNLLLNKFIQP